MALPKEGGNGSGGETPPSAVGLFEIVAAVWWFFEVSSTSTASLPSGFDLHSTVLCNASTTGTTNMARVAAARREFSPHDCATAQMQEAEDFTL